MTALLTIVGMVVGVVLGAAWTRRRARRSESAAPASAAEPSPEYGLIEDHRDAVVVADRDGQVVYRNRAARAIGGTHTGVLVDEAVDRHVAAAIEAGRSDAVLELYGPPKAVLSVGARSLGGRGVVVFIEDISERRRIEQVRTDFVANISHELRTPVGAMSVLAETLEGETDPATIRRLAERMMSEARRASRTIDDLIELSRIEAGGERSFEPIPVDAVVAGALERVTEFASQRGIELRDLTSSDPIDAATVVGDRRQLVSALGNLVENAVKYSEAGGVVEIRIDVSIDAVEFAVVDHGVGIPQRDLPRIFERFYRVDRARSRATGGTGLGLSIVRHVANNHGGEVSVASIEGEGSVFTLRLPVRDRDAVIGEDRGDIEQAGTDRGRA